MPPLRRPAAAPLRAFALALAMALTLAVVPAALPAQGPPRVDITPSSTPAAPTVAVRAVLGQRFDELLRNGFPARLHLRAELWTLGRWFDQVFARDEWDVIVSYDLIDRTYEVVRQTRDHVTTLGSYATFADARAASELPYTPDLPVPARGRRGYIVVQVDVLTMEMSDLDELQRWLRGEARPAVQGKRSPGTALGTGVRTLVTRLLGGEVRRLEGRSPTIVF